MNCPTCGYFMDALDKECVRCATLGKTKPAAVSARVVPTAPLQHSFRAPAQIVPTTADEPGDFTCPTCANAQTQRVSALVASSTQSIALGTYTAGGAHVMGTHINMVAGGVGVSSGSMTTHLAQQLGAPLPPKKRGYVALGVWCLIFACLCFDGDGALGLWLVLVAVFGILALVNFQFMQNEYPVNLANWNRRVQTWQRIVYCPRCGNVYDPHTRQSAQPVYMNSLL